MNKFYFIAWAILISNICLCSSVNAQSKQEMQEKYATFLNKKDIFSKVDSDGDVQFLYDGKTYFINIVENDPLYFRLVMPNIWPIESEEERSQVLRAIDFANSQIKVAKIYIFSDNVWVGVEGFMNKPDDYEAYFDRSLRVIKECLASFKEAMP